MLTRTMLYPYWSPSDTATLPNWIRAGQQCLCSESPNLSKSRIAIDCWLGDRWATQTPWTLVMQIPSLEDSAWRKDSSSHPSDTKRPVILAIQDGNHGGFYLGRRTYYEADRWRMVNAGRWSYVANEAVIGWLPIPHRLSHSFSSPLETSRQKLLAQLR